MRILSRRLQNPGTRHQDVIVLIVRELISTKRLACRNIDLASIQMQITGVHQHRTCSAVMLVQRVDLTGALQILQRQLAKFVEALLISIDASRGGFPS